MPDGYKQKEDKNTLRKDNGEKREAFYPVPEMIEELSRNMPEGNYGLWFNKYVPLGFGNKGKTQYKPCNSTGDVTEAVGYYCRKAHEAYKTETLAHFLVCKHIEQKQFCASMKRRGYEPLIFYVRSISRLITGIGYSHPTEIGMVFDHTLGVPYIPASSIKGIMRYANAKKLFEKYEDNEIFDDEAYPLTKEMFGSMKTSGEAIFLDAYPLKPPTLAIEIINPHYGKYYDKDDDTVFPNDCQQPVPVKFLTVEKGTEFIFRCIIPQQDSQNKNSVNSIFESAFLDGIGAKTSIGFGRFEVIGNSEPDSLFVEEDKLRKQRDEEEKRRLEEIERKRFESLSPAERQIEEINRLTKDRNKIGETVRKTLSGDFPKEVYVRLKEKLEELEEWNPQPGQSYQKMVERNNKIDSHIHGAL